MKKVEGMTIKEQSRWLALIQAMRCILDGCKVRKIQFDALDLSPNSMKDYIDNISVMYEDQLKQQQKHRIKIIVLKLKREVIKLCKLKTGEVVHGLHS